MSEGSRRGGTGNGVFGAWTATLRPTIGVLAAFRPEAWAGLAVLLLWLLIAVPYPFLAASNAMLVFAAGSLGYLVGSRVGQLGIWSGGILVPRYSGSLLTLCVFGVVLPALVTGLVCVWLGNPVPAVAPAPLIGAATTRYAIRRGLDPSIVVGWWLIVAVVAGNSAWVQSDLVQTASVLSNVWIQLSCAVAAGLIVRGVYWAVARPTTRVEATFRSPIWLGDFSLGNLRMGTSIAAGSLGMILVSWYFIPRFAEQVFAFVWFMGIAVSVFEWWETNVHIELSRNWVFGVARDRRDLGRRTAARVVWVSLPWLALGAGWSGIHAVVTAGAEAFFLKEVLLAHISALLIATSLCHLTRRLPPSFRGRLGVWVLLFTLFGSGSIYFSRQDYGTAGHAVLLFALIGAAILMVLLGGKALARAEVLTDIPARRQWREQKRRRSVRV